MAYLSLKPSFCLINMKKKSIHPSLSAETWWLQWKLYFLCFRTQRQSRCYRIVYRHLERTLTQQEVRQVHEQIERSAETELGVQGRYWLTLLDTFGCRYSHTQSELFNSSVTSEWLWSFAVGTVGFNAGATLCFWCSHAPAGVRRHRSGVQAVNLTRVSPLIYSNILCVSSPTSAAVDDAPDLHTSGFTTADGSHAEPLRRCFTFITAI